MTREQALETLKEMAFTAYGHRSEALDMAISALSAEPKKGEWIRESLCGYRCNQCGKIQMADDINELNFCCNCGADMRGET